MNGTRNLGRQTTHHELAAAQALLRLTHTARAALGGAEPPGTAAVLAVPIAEADEALGRAGLAGNEAWLLERIYDLGSPLEPERESV
ncbi:hypothetical protein GTW43_02135 [Streptomyces sp. SID5785]|uniref:hypothetical protein n=1 Tax=Streptomyces sp. SID5785 TaxID=2690309 RepID=UPI001361E149|nr:hypothetical protein [Streptomyces sp. SID5785]MZD03883.1 hypothetical protein [Streptomyces sp. SID5785]